MATTNTSEKQQQPIYKRNWFIILLLVLFAPVGIFLVWKYANWGRFGKVTATVFGIICLIIVFAAMSPSDEKKATTDTDTKQTTSSSSAKEEAGALSQNAAERYCQDASLLQNHIDIKKTSIVVATDYKPWFGDSGMKASNGDKIYTLQWSGKNKDTDAKVGFVCDVSGTDKSIKLHSLAIDGQSVYGPEDEN